MDSDIVITAVKIISALLGGALGVLGILFNFKQPNNRISGWGVVVLVGIVISAAVGVVGSIAENYKAKSEATHQAARTERMLRELSRAIQPITQLEITYWVRLPSESPDVRDYLAKVSSWIEANIASLRRVSFYNDERTHIIASGLNDEPLDIQIGRESALWPSRKYSYIAGLVGSFSFNVFIRKTPIGEDKFTPMIATGGQYADWIALGIHPDRNNLIFNRSDKQLEIFGNTEYKKALWKSNGKITSLTDLYGAQLFLVLPSYDLQLPERLKMLNRPGQAELARLIDLKTIVLRFSEGRDMWIDGKAFKKVKSAFGEPMFSIILPADDEGFRRLAPPKE